MRYSKFLIIFLIAILPLQILAQETKTSETDITGLWKGTIYNDTTKQFYRYEMGISEEKGKLTGFSHTWYNDSDKHYFAIKKVKIKIKDEKVIIEDVEVIAHNYPEKPPKGVKRLHILSLQKQDSILTLSGPFSTNQTKIFAPVTGTVNLQRKNDFRKQSDLIPHLQELKLDDELSFVVKEKELAKAEEDKSLSKTAAPINNNPATQKDINAPSVKKIDKKQIAVNSPKLPVSARVTKPANTGPAADVLTRKNVLQETMYFKTDSLVLTLYDNGEVDGDTVSVLMNGTILMAKQGLSTTAIRKTIHIPAETDSVELVMYAESLGTIPPNTGLLIVRDGRDTYEVRFSGDLQKNAIVVLKRRKN